MFSKGLGKKITNSFTNSCATYIFYLGIEYFLSHYVPNFDFLTLFYNFSIVNTDHLVIIYNFSF